MDTLDHDRLAVETLAGAEAWARGDDPTARGRLRAAFELLTQARERFYPVDAYLLDLVLLDPATPAESLRSVIDGTLPFSLIASAKAIETLAAADSDLVARLVTAIGESRADVAGGTYAETDECLRPIGSILWQYRKGSAVYRRWLDTRDVETFARRRFGLAPYVPALARRLGIRFALHLSFDDGRFPIPRETKKLWEGPDGTSLEALTRPPLAADRAATGLQLPWALARTMKDDHVATLPLAHWPEPVAAWLGDFRRIAAYSPVLARAATLSDYFHLTDRPYETFRPTIDSYRTPFLAQAVARGDHDPITRRVRHARARARLDGVCWLHAVASALGRWDDRDASPAIDLAALEDQIETQQVDDALPAVAEAEGRLAAAVASAIVGDVVEGRPGFLVINPAPVARRAPVLLPETAAPDLRPAGPLRAAQFTDEGVWAVVDVPAFGFAWIPAETDPAAAPITHKLSASKHVLRNEFLEVHVDETTGGIRSLKAVGEPSARLGQKLVVQTSDPIEPPAEAPRMLSDRFEIEYAGPSLVQAISEGTVGDPVGGPIARFRQRYRLWSGRPILELSIAITDLDSTWQSRLRGRDPWNNYLACRWAWPDANAMMRRSSLLAIELTEADRPETPDVLDLSTRKHRTALVFGGLAHHLKIGERMLDTLLVAGGETGRTFDLALTLDHEHPFQPALDQFGPPCVIAAASGPPRSGTTGWLFHIDRPSVAVTQVAYQAESGDGRGWGFRVHVRETSGQSARCRLRVFRDPVWARQIDDHGDLIVDLTVEGDAVLLDLTPHEMALVDISMG